MERGGVNLSSSAAYQPDLLRYPLLDPTLSASVNNHPPNSTGNEIVGIFSENVSQPTHQLQKDGTTDAGFPSSSSHMKKHSLHRSKTAPAMSVVRDLLHVQVQPHVPASSSIMKQALVLLIVYLSLGVLFYSLKRDSFSGVETHPVVDALYFCIVTMCTIGYGDIAPLTPATKIFACLFVLFGFGFLDILLTGVVNYFLDSQEKLILSGVRAGAGRGDRNLAERYMVDVDKGRMRIRLKVGLALGVLVFCVGTGGLVLYWMENLDWVDSFYLAVMSVTTVGYGDQAFNTLAGRLFASAWLLVSTLGVARAFLYLAEARIDKRNRRIVKWILQREMTLADLLAADLNNNGFLRKSEYVVHKLKEMGKIRDKDILLICDQFNKLDPNNSGKITLFDLLGRPN